MNAAIKMSPLTRAFFHLRDGLCSLSGATQEPIRSGGIDLPTGGDSPLPSCSAVLSGAAVLGQLRPFHFLVPNRRKWNPTALYALTNHSFAIL